MTRIESIPQLFSTLCDTYASKSDIVAVDIGRKPQLNIRYETAGPDRKSKTTINLDIDTADWQRWARRAAADWFAVTVPAVQTTLNKESVPGQLLVWSHYRVWQQNDIEIYHHAGPNRIYWMSGGLRDWEPVSSVLGGSYAVVTSGPISVLEKAWIRDMITVTRPGTWRLPSGTQDSTALTGTMVISDCLHDGVARPLVEETAAWLRQILPSYKVGAPTLDDVRLKLDLERRLRIEDKVAGSNRPLAFTLQAIDDVTFHWPGLWLISGHTEDFRTDLPVLLAWDAILAATSAIARLHVDVKPGLCYGNTLSQTVLRSERRFSKRDVGPTEGAYCQVNPARMVGPAPVVASRLLHAATHELTHVVLRQLQPHSEIFTSRREQLFLTASELLPAIIDLVTRVGLHQRPSRVVPVAPVPLDQWLHETLLHAPVASVSHLIQSWAAVRNLTEGRAQRDVEEALESLAASGRIQWAPGDAFVVNQEFIGAA